MAGMAIGGKGKSEKKKKKKKKKNSEIKRDFAQRHGVAAANRQRSALRNNEITAFMASLRSRTKRA